MRAEPGLYTTLSGVGRTLLCKAGSKADRVEYLGEVHADSRSLQVAVVGGLVDQL